MLYQALRLGCQKYHENESRYDTAYRLYIQNRNADKWDYPETLDYNEIYRLIKFVNSWGGRFPYSQAEDLLGTLKREVPKLNSLKYSTLVDIQLGQDIDGIAVDQLISNSFNKIANRNKYYSVATSKIIHTAINSNLFVMWDNRIQQSYKVGWGNGQRYVKFLLEMQKLAEQAIAQIMNIEDLTRNDAIKSMSSSECSLAKIMDEYNFMKYTRYDYDMWIL